MIILNANIELKKTFEKLIRTMKEPVEWNGQFVVVGDYLILSGRVRSLFFNFETRRVLTNIIDIPAEKGQTADVGDHIKVQNVLNMVLYAFGKWGMIRGVKVEQDYAQLNRIFTGVLQEFFVEPGYTHESFRFYKEGVRLNYEDVILLALESKDEEIGEVQTDEEASAGLWHKLVWKTQKTSFPKSETTYMERQKNRIGRNFYMVGYKCPKCSDYLHMAVFPEGKEFRIETPEGGVLLARGYACESCHCFYTPRPQKLLSEGDVYVMDFFEDVPAYEDYKELFGQKADRVSNCNYNQFETMPEGEAQINQKEPEESLEEVCSHMELLSEDALSDIGEMIEEGFYPQESVQRFERVIKNEAKKRRMARTVDKADETAKKIKETADAFRKPKASLQTASAVRKENARSQAEHLDAAAGSGSEAGKKQNADTVQPEKKKDEIPEARREAAKKRYAAKCQILDRLSPIQVTDLKNELLRDKNLYDAEKEPFLKIVTEKEKQQRKDRIHEISSGCRGQNYAKIRQSVEKIEEMDPSEEERAAVLEPLYKEKKKRGEAEVAELVKKIPQKMDMKQYNGYVERLKGYTEVDLSPYEEVLEEYRRKAEHQEIENAIHRAKSADRKGLTDLMDWLRDQNFERDILEPYLEELHERLHRMDEDAIAQICGDPKMTITETLEAYQKIEEGVFLPELKTNALEMLKKRIKKLKIEECDLLVHKLKRDLDGRIQKNSRHHFYPAGKVASQEAEPEEYEVVHFALDTYGTTRDTFEYPILVVDTSRDQSGKEGMILTPEHIFYRTMFHAYVVPIEDMKRMHSQTGLFNTGLFIEMKDGSRIKIPYAVEKKEIVAWGNCLEEFIHYLQEKPDSRTVTYLAKEKHETICCFRCGYTYKTGNVCPKCGYKMNR